MNMSSELIKFSLVLEAKNDLYDWLDNKDALNEKKIGNWFSFNLTWFHPTFYSNNAWHKIELDNFNVVHIK